EDRDGETVHTRRSSELENQRTDGKIRKADQARRRKGTGSSRGDGSGRTTPKRGRRTSGATRKIGTRRCFNNGADEGDRGRQVPSRKRTRGKIERDRCTE